MRNQLQLSILSLCLVLFLSINSTLVSAENIGTQRNQIMVTNACPDCTINNITWVRLANNSILEINDEMVQEDTFYHYAISKNFTSELGNYVAYGIWNPNGTTEVWEYPFQIAKNNQLLSTSEGLIYVILILITFVLFCFFLAGAVITPFANPRDQKGNLIGINWLKYVKLTFVWFAYAFFLWCLTLMTGVANNYLQIDYIGDWITKTYNWFYAGAYALTIIIGVIFFVALLIDLVFNKPALEEGKRILGMGK